MLTSYAENIIIISPLKLALKLAQQHYMALKPTHFKSPSRLMSFHANRALLYHALTIFYKLDQAEIKINFNTHGKPYLDQNKSSSQIFFNISHSHDYIALILSKNGEVGIDIEKIKPRKHIDALACRVFKASEIIWINNQTNVLASFYRLWSLKEAYLKATGEGLAGLSSVLIDCEKLQITGNLHTQAVIQSLSLEDYSLAILEPCANLNTTSTLLSLDACFDFQPLDETNLVTKLIYTTNSI